MSALAAFFTPNVIALLVTGFAVALTLARLPLLISLGLPALVGTLAVFGVGQGAIPALQELVSPLHSYEAAGLILWSMAGGVLVASGVYSRHLVALYALASRPVTNDDLARWHDVEHGLPSTLIALVLFAGIGISADAHLVTLLATVPILVIALVTRFRISINAPFSQTASITEVPADGQAKRRWRRKKRLKGASRVEVLDRSNRVIRLVDKTDAFIAIMPLAVLAIILLFALLLGPTHPTDLGAIALLWSLVFGLARGGSPLWLGGAGYRAMYEAAYVGTQVLGAFALASFYRQAGIWQVIGQVVTGAGASLWAVAGGVMIVAAILGTVLGSEVGAILAVAAVSTTVVDAGGNAPPWSVAILATAGLVGGVFARILPPRSQPSPLLPAPVVGAR